MNILHINYNTWCFWVKEPTKKVIGNLIKTRRRRPEPSNAFCRKLSIILFLSTFLFWRYKLDIYFMSVYLSCRKKADYGRDFRYQVRKVNSNNSNLRFYKSICHGVRLYKKIMFIFLTTNLRRTKRNCVSEFERRGLQTRKK